MNRQSLEWIILGVLWLVWMVPFATRRRGGGQKATVKARSARWGMFLEGAGFAIASFHYSSWPQPSVARMVVSIALGLSAPAIAWFAVSALGNQWRFDAALNSDHDLIQSGPYAIVRHPIYSSMLAMLLAMGLMLSTWLLLLPALAVFFVGTEIRVRAEEKLLIDRFGNRFEEYRRRVPAYIPGLR